MNIDKDQIIALLKSQGKEDHAAQAATELPATVDTNDDGHKDLLSKFGVDPSEIEGKLGGLSKFL